MTTATPPVGGHEQPRSTRPGMVQGSSALRNRLPAKPVNDLSRGALVDDIVYTLALTAIQSRTG